MKPKRKFKYYTVELRYPMSAETYLTIVRVPNKGSQHGQVAAAVERAKLSMRKANDMQDFGEPPGSDIDVIAAFEGRMRDLYAGT